MITHTTEIKKLYKDLIEDLSYVVKKLIRLIEYTNNFTPNYHQHSENFLKEIDKEIRNGTRRFSAWRDKVKAYKIEE